MKPIRILLFLAQDSNWTTLSYATSMPGAIARSPHFKTTIINLGRRSIRSLASATLRAMLGCFDAAFVMHSVFSNVQYMPRRLSDLLVRSRIPVVYFVGNEYKLMPEKMAFAEHLETRLLVTQIAVPDVHRLYADRLGCRTLFLPNAVADPIAFPPGPPLPMRKINVGYRAYDSIKYLGHDDRRAIADIVGPAAAAQGLVCDISLDPAKRFAAAEWVRFLHECRTQLGVESGTDYFELDDCSRLKGNALEAENPEIDLDTYHRLVFGSYKDRVSGRTITSRHLECATTRTPMVMFAGAYCGVFEADKHYISVARDGSNIDEVLSRIADVGHCAEIAARAEASALAHFGEQQTMDRLSKAVRAIQ